MGSGSASSNSKKSLTFRVTRQKPELVRPAKSTPREFKLLSDIDDQEGLRTQLPAIHFYHNHNNDPRINGTRRRSDPVKVIREAIAKALVFYYPFAGRLREGPGRKLMVDCTGEGVLFIEADADVMLEQFGDALQPPFPCLEELLYDVPHSGGILHCPLLLIQVTRLRCGGFIFALRLNHTMADGAGLSQFMNAVGEIARGASAPSIQPVWQRELLNARDPPRVTCTHHEYDQVDDTKGSIIPQDDMVHRSFFFGPAEISALRKLIPADLSHKCSTFDVLTACLWRCRTIALQPEPNEEVRVMCIVNARSKFNPPLPQGYYGNVIAYPTALMTAGELCNKPVGYAVELVTKVKRVVTEDYMRSVADLMVIKGRPHFTLVRTYLVSDGTRARLTDVDFGWGKPVYGGPAKGTVASFHIAFKNKKGEKGRVVPIFLPGLAMDRFVSELNNLLLSNNVHRGATTDRSISVKSAL